MTTARTKTGLEMATRYRLMQLIEAEYAEKRLEDKQFAAYANEKFSTSVINGNHVNGCRNALGIQSTRVARLASPDADKLVDYVASLEKRVTALEWRLEIGPTGSRK